MTPIVFTIYPFGKCPPSASFYPLEWPLKTVKFESVMSSIRLWSGLPSAQTALYKIAIYSLLRHTLVMNRRYNLYFIIDIQYMCNTPREKKIYKPQLGIYCNVTWPLFINKPEDRIWADGCVNTLWTIILKILCTIWGGGREKAYVLYAHVYCQNFWKNPKEESRKF